MPNFQIAFRQPMLLNPKTKQKNKKNGRHKLRKPRTNPIKSKPNGTKNVGLPLNHPFIGTLGTLHTSDLRCQNFKAPSGIQTEYTEGKKQNGAINYITYKPNQTIPIQSKPQQIQPGSANRVAPASVSNPWPDRNTSPSCPRTDHCPV